MRDFWTVNFENVIQAQRHTANYRDIIEKVYAAGFITHYGNLIIFGTGAERGTYGSFVNLHIQGCDFRISRYSLTWFTNIYSTALRNQGNTFKKTNFYLSQRQEIYPILDFFGLRPDFYSALQEVKDHDRINDLPYEWQTKGKIHDWEKRTKLISIALEDKEITILDAITENMLTPDTLAILAKHGVKNPKQFIADTFIEGTRGLLLSPDDMTCLCKGNSILSRYAKAS